MCSDFKDVASLLDVFAEMEDSRGTLVFLFCIIDLLMHGWSASVYDYRRKLVRKASGGI